MNLLDQAKVLLTPLAIEHVPQGSEVDAVIDQWLHAIATDGQLYCNSSLLAPDCLKENILSHLQKNDLFSSRECFFNEIFNHLKLKPSLNCKFRFIDLFAGIGGIRLGFQKNNGVCVFSSEFDKNAQTTYKLNHGEIPFGDITKINPKNIPDHDILLAGFPCQAFSIAGYRQGFDDEKGRGNLFFNIYDILVAKKPKAFMLENVKNLQAHDNGNTFKVILEYLNDAGYCVKYKVINSMDVGNIPQNRERIYIVGFKNLYKDKLENFNFPEKQELKKTVRDLLDEKVDESFYYEKYDCYQYLKDSIVKKDTVYQWRRQYVRENKSNVCPTLTANMGSGGHNVPLILDENNRIRKLTPRECSKIQGFDEFFLLPNIANSHLYKQFGNSVTVPVIDLIAKEITSLLQSVETQQ